MTKLRIIIARARRDAGLTIDQMSEAVGVSRQTILNLGSGKYRGDLATWLKISRVVGVDLGELLAPVWESHPDENDRPDSR